MGRYKKYLWLTVLSITVIVSIASCLMLYLSVLRDEEQRLQQWADNFAQQWLTQASGDISAAEFGYLKTLGFSIQIAAASDNGNVDYRFTAPSIRSRELTAALQGRQGSVRYQADDGHDYLAVYRPLAGRSALAVSIPLNEIQSQYLSSFLQIMLINLALVVICMAGFYHLVRPLEGYAGRRRLENALKWEHMTGVALLLSPRQVLLEASPGFSERFDLNAGERLQKLMPGHEQSRTGDYLQQALDSDDTLDFECTLNSRREGSSHWSLSVRRWQYQGQTYLLVTGDDISKRHGMEIELRAEQQRVSAYFNAMQTLLIICDSDGRILRLNQPVQTLLNMDEQQLVQQPLSYLIPRSGAIAFRADLRRLLGSHEDNIATQFPLVSASGRESIISWRMTRLNDGRHGGGEILLAGLDITDSVANQQALETANRRIRETLEQAEQANRSKSVFLANMSHEIRTPMNGILGAAELLLDSSLTEDQRHYLSIIHSSSHVLLDIINDILDLSKIESGKLEVESISFDLNELLTRIYQLFNEPVRRKGLSLVYYYDGQLPVWWLGDPKRIRQIITNLLSNALKFTTKGRIEIRISGEQSGDHQYNLLLAVSDNGIGIAEEKQQQIFEAFRQADSSTSRQYGGTGLGLTISRHLARAMNGDIRLQSEIGNGSTFTLCLPLHEGTPTVAETPAVTSGQPPALSGRILLAEDNVVNQKIAERMLERLGLAVTTVGNGEEAITEVLAHDYDLILMDVNMPVLDGLTATGRIRDLSSDKSRIPVIALTANAMPEDRQRCLDAGMDDFISKPMRMDELTNAIARALQQNQELSNSP